MVFIRRICIVNDQVINNIYLYSKAAFAPLCRMDTHGGIMSVTQNYVYANKRNGLSKKFNVDDDDVQSILSIVVYNIGMVTNSEYVTCVGQMTKTRETDLPSRSIHNIYVHTLCKYRIKKYNIYALR